MPLLDALKENWNRFVLFAAAIGTLFSTFLILPPSGGGENVWYQYGAFLVAVLTGLWFVPMIRWSARKFAARWWIAAAVCAVISTAAFLSYNNCLERWTVAYWRDRRAVIGEHLTEDARVYRASTREPIDDLQLLKLYGGAATAVWRADEIETRQHNLALLYLLTLLALASTVVTVAQAAYCVNRTRGRTVSGPAERARAGDGQP